MRLESRLTRLLLHGGLAVAILATGSLHWHPRGSSPDHWRTTGNGDILRHAASHPSAPLHVESFELKREPRCFQCLLRQKNDALGPLALLPAALAREVTTASLELEPAVLRRAAGRRHPRGPPVPEPPLRSPR
jgi:hypothetical protein